MVMQHLLFQWDDMSVGELPHFRMDALYSGGEPCHRDREAAWQPKTTFDLTHILSKQIVYAIFAFSKKHGQKRLKSGNGRDINKGAITVINSIVSGQND